MESPDSYMASKRKAACDRTVRADGLFTDDQSVFQPDFFDIVSLFFLIIFLFLLDELDAWLRLSIWNLWYVTESFPFDVSWFGKIAKADRTTPPHIILMENGSEFEYNSKPMLCVCTSKHALETKGDTFPRTQTFCFINYWQCERWPWLVLFIRSADKTHVVICIPILLIRVPIILVWFVN